MASTLSKLRNRWGFSGKTRASSLPGDLCRRFSIDEIKTATHNFNKELILGEGRFGAVVYKGFIDEGHSRPVVIKVGVSAEDFRTETILLCQIRHVHILPFIGYCTDKGQRILVYEFMANNSLRHHLYATDKASCLLWKRRLQICIGAARGLNYLHTGLKYPVIHLNVKTTNILLDEKWAAKVSDFGFSVNIKFCNLVVEDTRGTLDVGFSEQIPSNITYTYNVLSGERVPLDPDTITVSTRMVDDMGYLAPEMFHDIGHPPITEKSDVYSFGMVLLEVLCGQRLADLHLVTGAHGWNKYGSMIGKIIDPYLKGKIAPESYKVYLEVATACMQLEPIQRPTMLDVMEKLELALELQEKTDAEGKRMITPYSEVCRTGLN